MIIIKTLGLILTGLFLTGILLTAYAIAGIRHMEHVNQAREEDKDKV